MLTCMHLYIFLLAGVCLMQCPLTKAAAYPPIIPPSCSITVSEAVEFSNAIANPAHLVVCINVASLSLSATITISRTVVIVGIMPSMPTTITPTTSRFRLFSIGGEQGVENVDFHNIKFANADISSIPETGGGAVYSSQNSRIVFYGCVFSGNLAQAGGSIAVLFSSLRLRSCSFEMGAATDLGMVTGGAIFAWESPVVIEDTTMHGLTTQDPDSLAGSGIAFYSAANTLSMVDSSCGFHTTNGQASCLYIGDGAKAYLIRSRLANVVSTSSVTSSIIYVASNAFLSISDSVVTDIHTTLNIGVPIIASARSALYLERSNFTDNSGTVGVIRVYSAAKITALNCRFERNIGKVVLDGAGNLLSGLSGVFFTDGKEVAFYMEGCVFANNAGGFGGVISSLLLFETPESVLVTRACEFSSNLAIGGAAINLAGVFKEARIESCDFTKNIANSALVNATSILGMKDYGAAINAGGNIDIYISGSTFLENLSADIGGAIRLGVNAIVYITESGFLKNRSGSKGGAIYSESKRLYLKDSSFSSNFVSDIVGAKGHALYVEKTLVAINSCDFVNNLGSTNAQTIGEIEAEEDLTQLALGGGNSFIVLNPPSSNVILGVNVKLFRRSNAYSVLTASVGSDLVLVNLLDFCNEASSSGGEFLLLADECAAALTSLSTVYQSSTSVYASSSAAAFISSTSAVSVSVASLFSSSSALYTSVFKISTSVYAVSSQSALLYSSMSALSVSELSQSAISYSSVSASSVSASSYSAFSYSSVSASSVSASSYSVISYSNVSASSVSASSFSAISYSSVSASSVSASSRSVYLESSSSYYAVSASSYGAESASSALTYTNTNEPDSGASSASIIPIAAGAGGAGLLLLLLLLVLLLRHRKRNQSAASKNKARSPSSNSEGNIEMSNIINPLAVPSSGTKPPPKPSALKASSSISDAKNHYASVGPKNGSNSIPAETQYSGIASPYSSDTGRQKKAAVEYDQPHQHTPVEYAKPAFNSNLSYTSPNF